MKNRIIDSFKCLKHYCESEHFKGRNPYGGLDSRVFQALPFLKRVATCRSVVVQGFECCPTNSRRIVLVPEEYSARGTGLFLSGYYNLYKAVQEHLEQKSIWGTAEQVKEQIVALVDSLISLCSRGNYDGACWGYNFGWQARRLFFFLKNVPAVMATDFCATALIEAYEITEDERYSKVALSAADSVTRDLHRTPYKDEFLFSCNPLKGNGTVSNAFLLGPRLLSYCYRYTHNNMYRDLAGQSIKACYAEQRQDEVWAYGTLLVQNWVDSLHTGYNLDASIVYQELTGDRQYNTYIEKGFDYYIRHLPELDRIPKYSGGRTHPIDARCPRQLFVTLTRLHKHGEYVGLVEGVLSRTILKMQGKKGYFYYQLKPSFSSKTSHMRWSNAFMLNAMPHYLMESECI